MPIRKTNKRLAYIGQDLFLSGQMMGERIVKLVGSGKVAIFIATPGQLNLQPRFDGAMDSIKKSGADIQATMIATAPAANESLSKIEAYYLGNQDVKGMFGTGGGDTMNCGLVSRSTICRRRACMPAATTCCRVRSKQCTTGFSIS